MLKDKSIKIIKDYINSNECFNGVDIAGGVCYFLRDNEYSGKCIFTSIYNSMDNTIERDLDEFDIFPRNNRSLSIIYKVLYKKEKLFKDIISVQTPFGLITTFKGRNDEFMGSIKLKTSKGYSYISHSDITKNVHMIDKYKVIFGAATCEHGGIPDSSGKFKVFSSLEIISKSNSDRS